MAMKIFKVLLCLVLAPMLSINTARADFYCETTVIRALVYADGTVNVLTTARGDYTFVCNVSTPWKGVDVTTCAAWLSVLQSVKRRNGLAILYYTGAGTCATLPTYALSPAPAYIGDATP